MFFKGSKHQDQRGIVTYNNAFDASAIKRIYTIENRFVDFIRGWQGHKIEQRWFACMKGSFRVAVIRVDDFQNPSRNLVPQYFTLNAEALDFLHVESGCITAMRALEEESKLLVLSDYALGEIDDEYRYPIDYFKTEL